ncbi:MAG: beta-Ala-His dipeptidase, partial [Azoarcus sp.]|nr:beta-Ala-His dipeptidase [Azoarcus sp.]
MMDLSSLQPVPVWRHFLALCQIPRASDNEGAVRDALSEWARARGLGVVADAAGNLVLSKPATPGFEHRPGVVLQGHLDMVCQKHDSSTHDFGKDPIRPVLREGWVMAEATTLGADNGIGVALALAALEVDDLAHPALEVLLTVKEESGMHGALALRADALKGRLLLNLDTEEWGEIYTGCAGSVDVIVDASLPMEAFSPDLKPFTLRLSGLAGGHSGIDIHRGRGNAIKLLLRLLHELSRQGVAFHLVSMEGGTAHNAIPREAEASLLTADIASLRAKAETLADGLRVGLGEEDAGLRFDFGVPAHAPGAALSAGFSRKLLTLLHDLPYGAHRMSEQMPGVVETSNNVGILRLVDGHLRLNAMVRSLNEAGIRALAGEIVYLFTASGFDSARIAGAGPCWTPNPRSKLLALARNVYHRTFGGEDAKVQVIHAGLEYGVFSAIWPDMD